MYGLNAITCPCTCHTGGRCTPCTIPGGCGHLHTPTLTHRCYRGERCTEWEWVEDPAGGPGLARVGREINTTSGLCLACVRHTERALAELPRDYTELHLMLGRGMGAAAGEPVSRSRELPVPLRLDVEAVLSAMLAETTCWAEAVAEPLNVAWDSTLVDHHTRPGVAMQRACQLLAGALSPLLAVRDWTRMVWLPDGWGALPEARDGVDGAVTLLELHHQARRVTGMTRLRHRMPVPCPNRVPRPCERMTLIRDDGDDYVYCTSCGVWYSHDEYLAYTSALSRSVPA